MGVFVAGLLVITAVLVIRHPLFGLFTPAAYIYSFTVLRWPWRLLGVAATAVLAGTAQASNIPTTDVLGLTLAVIVIPSTSP
ncbi:hypothetical protein ACFSTC_11470 [Nonomuraea ferruginea]